jgi:MFS family permease
VFVPVFLQAAAGVSPTQAGLLLVPMMGGVTLSTTLAGRSIARTGRYKRFPILGLALMTAALTLLGAVASQRSVLATAVGLAVFGLGFGLVTQVLIVAVQNAVDRRRLGIATATTSFFRALGGAVSAAVLGVVFASGAGAGVGADTTVQSATLHNLDAVGRVHLAHAVQTVFFAAAPLAAVALIVLLWLPEHPLQTRGGQQAPSSPPAASESPSPSHKEEVLSR